MKLFYTIFIMQINSNVYDIQNIKKVNILKDKIYLEIYQNHTKLSINLY